MKKDEGFILVTTIWVLALLTIAASFFALWTQRTVSLAQASQADLQGEIDMYNTQTHVLYLMATQRFNIAGLTIPTTESLEDKLTKEDKGIVIIDNSKMPHPAFSMLPPDDGSVSILPVGGEIALDDRVYLGDGNVLFAIQDKGGLLNINLETHRVARLLGVLGVEPILQDALVAKLQDYIDADDLHRLNGAEKYHYTERGLPPPRNRYLLVPLEVRRVLDWAEQATLWENDKLGQLVRFQSSARPDFNTAPVLVLQAAYNLTAEGAERIVKRRQIAPFYRFTTLTEVAGSVPDVSEEEVNYFPSTRMRLTLWRQGSQRIRQVHLHLTPYADGKKPWQIQYTLEHELFSKYAQAVPISTQADIFNSTLSPTPQ